MILEWCSLGTQYYSVLFWFVSIQNCIKWLNFSDNVEYRRAPFCHRPAVPEALHWLLGRDLLTSPDSVKPAELDWRTNSVSNPVSRILVMLIPDNFLGSSPVEKRFSDVLVDIHDHFDTVFSIGRKKESRSRR